MENLELGPIVGERELDYVGGKRILIRIGIPRAMPDQSGFFCPYQISGLGDDKIRRAVAGIDTINALQVVLQKIGIDLHILNEACGGSLRWEAGDHGDLGFPLPPSISAILNSR